MSPPPLCALGHVTIKYTKYTVVLVWITVLIAASVSKPAFSAEGGVSVYAPGFYGDFGMADIGPEGFEISGLAYYQSVRSPKLIKGGQLNAHTRENSYVLVPMATYVTDYKILGGRYFAGLRVGIAYNTTNGDFQERSSPPEAAHQFGIEDRYVFPVGLAWQFREASLAFFQGFNVPIGQYDNDNPTTLGSHYWASDTNLAFTWEGSKRGQEISLNVGYLVNWSNPATHYRTGNGIHLDYLIGQHLSPDFAVGIAGYLYRQVTADSGSGARLGPFKLQTNGIGPAVTYGFEWDETEVDLTAKWIQDFGVSNGLFGSHFFVDVGFRF